MSRRSRTALAVALMVTILGAGIAIGLVIGRRTGGPTATSAGERFGPPGPFRARGPMFERFKTRLDLDDAQAEQVSAILEAAATEAGAVHERVLPELSSIRERSREAIRALLTPEQAAEYEKLTAEIEERMRRRGGRRGPRSFEQAFASVDQDGDGRLSRAECDSSEHRLGRMCARRFDDIDTDSSGSVEAEEIKRAREQMRRRFDGPDRRSPGPTTP